MSKEFIYRGRTFTVTKRGPESLEIGYQGHSGIVGVSRRGPERLPYFHTLAEPSPARKTPVEIPAANLSEAVRKCCDGLINRSCREAQAPEFDREKAVQAMHDWYEAIQSGEEPASR